MGKSTSMPPPDPRLIDAQIESLGIQNEAIQRMVGLTEEMAPLQKEQLMQTIQQQAQLWAQSQEDRDYMLGRRGVLTGIQDRMVGEMSGFHEGDRRAQIAGQASADVAQTFEQARGAMDRDLTRTGVNPNDGRGLAAKSQMRTMEALAHVQGRNAAGQQARGERLQIEDRAHNALAGYPAMSMQAQGQGLQTMAGGASAINAGLGGALAGHQAVAGAAGNMGSNATNMWGAQANAYLQDQQNANAGWSAFGSALGMAGGAFLGKKFG